MVLFLHCVPFKYKPMHIKKIKISKFKCFEDVFELELNKEINIIVGNNEAGKSTLIEAIHLALSGWFKGRYIFNELTQHLFNKKIVDAYLASLQSNSPQEPPNLWIELYFSSDAPEMFKGNSNTDKSDAIGVSFNAAFDEKYRKEYKELVNTKSIKSLPIEYYSFYWESFSRDDKITPRAIPIKSALVDSSTSRSQNGSDLYLNRIVKDFLTTKEVVDISQSHRKMKDAFMDEGAIKAVNKKIQADSQITNKKVELSVELSTKSAWENSLLTYIDEIPFHFIGKGEQSVIKTKLALGHKKAQEANVLLIEEPENHLSHSKLNELIDALLSKREDKQVILSTHNSFVANKLGLDSLILLSAPNTTKFSDLSSETFEFYQKLSGYDTLRLILCQKAILVEGDSDELIVQKAYAIKHQGRLPINDAVDVISVGTSFLRFLELAERLMHPTVVVTDTDWSLIALESKYENYIGDNEKDFITISYDSKIDSGNLTISGKAFNYNTLEPKLLKVNSLELFNKIFGTGYESVEQMHVFMKSNKTKCALALFKTKETLTFPDYINAIV